MRLITIVTGLFIVTACSRSPTGPSTPVPASGPNAGTWTGTVRDAANGQGDLRLSLQETAANGSSVLAGSWTVTYADGAKNANGEVSGGVAGTTVFLTLRRTPALTCSTAGLAPHLNGGYVALALTLSGGTIAGPYTYQGCEASTPGTLAITKP